VVWGGPNRGGGHFFPPPPAPAPAPTAPLKSGEEGCGGGGGVKWPGRGIGHPTPSSTKVERRVELYIYSLSGLSWPVLG